MCYMENEILKNRCKNISPNSCIIKLNRCKIILSNCYKTLKAYSNFCTYSVMEILASRSIQADLS